MTLVISYSAPMRWYCILLLVLAGCTSTWERHERRLADDEARGDYARAAADARWLVDNAFYQAPESERTPAADAARYLHLADLAAKAGNARLAVEALREALTTDPHQAAAVRAQLGRLPLGAAEIDRLQHEFAWNAAALAPGDDAFVPKESDQTPCWSYRVREVRIRRRQTVNTADGMQRRVSYDTRPWIYDANASEWHPDGAWVNDVGTEAELVSGPDQPRYRAVIDADHGFYADDTVPPCHRASWQGPYDPKGTVFIAARLPGSQPKTTHFH